MQEIWENIAFIALSFAGNTLIITIHYLCQPKIHFWFSYQTKAKVNVGKEFIWLGCILHE